MRRHGFTLIELLVVIAIIALLVSILLPSLNRATELAQTVVCATHLREMNTGFVYYADEYDGWAPHNKLKPNGADDLWNWGDYIAPYFELTGQSHVTFPGTGLFWCPATGQDNALSYGLNINLSSQFIFHRIADERTPAQSMRLGDSFRHWHNSALCNASLWRSVAVTRHSGGANYLFCDGQVRWVTSEHMAFGWSAGENHIWDH